MLSLNDRIADEIVAHHVRVLRLASGAFDRVARLLHQLDKQTADLLFEIANSDGVITRVDAAIQAVYQLNMKAYRQIGKELKGELSELALHEVQYSNGLMMSLAPKAKFSLPPKPYVRAIVDEEPMFGGLFSEWIEGLAQGRYQRIRNAIRLSAAANGNVMDLIKQIRGQKALGFRDGIANTSLRSAKMLINTSYSSVANKARYDFFTAKKKRKKRRKKKKVEGKVVIEVRVDDKVIEAINEGEVEIEGFMWAATLDEATCVICDGLDGQYFEAEEFYEIYASSHPNCRCVGIPMIDVEEFEFVRPTKLKYEDWLRRQPMSFQQEILGPARAAMFKRGMPMKKFVDASGIRYNLSELRNIEGDMISKTKSKAAAREDTRVLRNWGFFPDLPDRRDQYFGLVHKEQLQIPTRISLRAQMPLIWDQGSLGSCVAYSAIATHMFAHPGEPMLSALDLYWKARYLEDAVDEDSGCMIRDAVKALQKWGVCTEKTWPYLIRKFRTDPPKAADQEALKYRITSYARLNSLQDCMNCLARGYPFLIGFSLYESFLSEMTEKTGIALMPGDDEVMIGGHCVVGIGLDQNFHENPVFKRSGLSKSKVPKFMMECRNIWTAKWGDAGNFWIPADYVNDSDLSADMWMIKT